MGDKTIKVRIAVLVYDNKDTGMPDWYAEGYPGFDAENLGGEGEVFEMIREQVQKLFNGEVFGESRLVWVEAEIPLPPGAIAVKGELTPNLPAE